jgi:hypothetical protein
MALADKKVVGAPFRNEGRLVRVVYDFAIDAGAIKDYDVLEAEGALLVELLSIDCKTALVATATANLDLGKGDGGVEFKSALDIGGDIAVDVQTPADTAGTMVELADGEKIVMGVDTEVITAGKLEYVFRVYSR